MQAGKQVIIGVMHIRLSERSVTVAFHQMLTACLPLIDRPAPMWRNIISSRFNRQSNPPVVVDDAFNVSRAKRLVTQTRYLYIGLLITVFPAMKSSTANAPYWATTVLPLIIGGLLLVGFLAMLPVKQDRITPRWAKKFIRDATWSSPLVAVLCSTWCVTNWLYAPPGMRAYYPLILCMGSLATAYCLSSIRFAAILNMAIGLFPISILMLLSGGVMDMVAATCILVAAVFLLQMIFDQHEQWVSLLTLQHEVQVQADTDPLTGLLNRRALTRRMETQMQADGAGPFLLALLDLDGFKPVNDQHGHGAGDALLCAVAERLLSAAGEGAAVARMGGDEFAVLLPPASTHSTDTITATLLTALISPFSVEEQRLKIGASVGAAMWPQHGSDIKALFENADRALYAIKNANREKPNVESKQAA
jgi:diguanylate cyclase